MSALILLAAVLLSGTAAFTMNWLALIPWRRSKGRHWSERARAYHPVRMAAAANLWVIPVVFALADLALRLESFPHWALVLAAAAIGVLVGTAPMDREVFPRIPVKELLQQATVAWLFRFLMWSVFLGVIVLMPEKFNGWVIALTGLFLGLLIFYERVGWILCGRWMGWFQPPPERLLAIVQATAAKMKVSVSEVLLMRSPLALAYAMPSSRRLLFSDRLLELLSDEEIAGVAAHELAHLSEQRRQYFQRYLAWLFFLPWLYLKLAVSTLGMPGFALVLMTSLLTPFIWRRISHKLEVRADSLAHSNESDPGTYARALLRLHEDNLVPAVLAKENATHPHLYDRMLAAGVTPDFPRPTPPSSLAWNGVLFSGTLGVLAMILVSRLIEKTL